MSGCFRYHGDKLIKGSKYSSSLNIDQKLYYLAKLEIINTEETDSGEYKAEAVNMHGICVANVNLNFNDDHGLLKWVDNIHIIITARFNKNNIGHLSTEN